MVVDDTFNIFSHSEHHFDPSGLDEWMVPFIQLLFHFGFICPCLGLVKGNDMVQECLPFVVALFQREVNISVLMPIFLFIKVVWYPT
jgi:hypothetical protein